MSSRLSIFCLLTTLGCSWFAQAQAPLTRSTSKERSQVGLTIYNDNLVLVREQRTLTLPTGVQQIAFGDVAETIRPETVHIKSLATQNLRILEQNYRFDLITPQKLMDAHIGKRVRIYRYHEKTGLEQAIDAELLSTAEGPIFRIGKEITTAMPGRLAYEGLPSNLIPQPTLVWLLDNPTRNPSVEVSYLANGMSWKSDYVMVLNENDSRADLTGWVTLENHTGTGFQDASVKLVAGDVQQIRAEPPKGQEMMSDRMTMAKTASAPQFQEEGLLDYHLYTLQRKANVLNNEQKQIALLEAKQVNVKKILMLYAQTYFYRSAINGPLYNNQKLGIYVTFDNKKANRLGMPLPKGIVRVYKSDASKAQQFLGEDRIDHTAEDEAIKIKLGDAFDVVADRKQLSWSSLGNCGSESTWQIEIRNHKKTLEEVHLLEPAGGDWEVSGQSHPYTREDAHTFKFIVKVPPKNKTVVKYKLKTRWC